MAIEEERVRDKRFDPLESKPIETSSAESIGTRGEAVFFRVKANGNKTNMKTEASKAKGKRERQTDREDQMWSLRSGANPRAARTPKIERSLQIVTISPPSKKTQSSESASSKNNTDQVTNHSNTHSTTPNTHKNQEQRRSSLGARGARQALHSAREARDKLSLALGSRASSVHTICDRISPHNPNCSHSHLPLTNLHMMLGSCQPPGTPALGGVPCLRL
jgi:hypothetical protein